MTVTEPGFQARAADAGLLQTIEGRSQWRLTWQRLRRDKVTVTCAAVITVLAVFAIAAPAIAGLTGHGPADQFPDTGLSATGGPAGPGRVFWLGADELGRDVFVRVLYGARISLLVGLVTTAIGTVTGVSAGLAAGYFGGWIDTVVSRFVDAVLAFPYVLLGVALAVLFGPSLSVVVAVISFFAWAGIARVVRGETLSIKEKEYIAAARSLGAGPWRIMCLDILPNLLGPVLVLATLSIPSAVIFEATLSFLGLGVQPPTASWGNMLAGAQNYYSVAWWYLVFPALALLITTLAFNLIGDGIRDALDPRAESIVAASRVRRRRPRSRPPGNAAAGAARPGAVAEAPRDTAGRALDRGAGATGPTLAHPHGAGGGRLRPAAGDRGDIPMDAAEPSLGPVPFTTMQWIGRLLTVCARACLSGKLTSLLRFLLRRILTGIVVLWVVSLATFLLFFTRPAVSVARQMAGKEPTAATLKLITKQLGLNDPIPVQYWHFLDRLLHGNLGYSYATGEPVTSILAQDVPRTASVVAGAVVLWLIAGLSVGILSAARARSLFDRLATVGVLAGLSLPTFVLGQLLLWAVFLQLNKHGFSWIQDGYVSPTQSLPGWAGHMILPWITLATVSAAVYSRLSRSSLLDTLGEDYIRTARAKGLSERRVILRHALRSALTPVVSQLGTDIGTLLGGVVVTEAVFGIGGLGSDSVAAIEQDNLPVIIGIVLIAAVFVVVANIIVDLCYRLLDPRVQIT
jgi:peptide/nickel transport system permease protein